MRCITRNSLFHGADSEKLAEFYHACGADRYRIYYAREADRHRMWRGRTSPYSAASARRRGPTLAVKLSSYRAAARRRDSERTDPRQLCQLEWRCARAGGFIYFYWIYSQVNVASSYIFIVNSSVHLCINSSLDESFPLKF